MVKSKLSIFKRATFSIELSSIILSMMLIFISVVNASIPAPGGSGTTCPNGQDIHCSGVKCSLLHPVVALMQTDALLIVKFVLVTE